MSFVLYDVETTGIDRHFDQILQFAATRADNNLQQVDSFETSCRLLPHIIPSPNALATNGLSIGTITDPRRKSHYAMMREIHETLAGWGPTAFLGFNSLRFDEEFLRHGFYQCLLPPYLTNQNRCTRADVLSLARAFAAFHPDRLTVPQTADGRPTFSLRAFATANGFPDFAAHEAMADVRATLHVCRLVAEHAPELWSRFLRFAQRAAAADFLSTETALLLFEPTARRASYCVTRIGSNRNPKQAHIHYCLNLHAEIEVLQQLSQEDLSAALAADRDIIRRVRVNAAPMLCPLFEAPEHLLGAWTEQAWEARAAQVQADRSFTERLLLVSEAAETIYDTSPHVERQLYEQGFWPDSDAAVLVDFHAAPWEDRAAIARQLADRRLRILARRLLFVERPDLFVPSERETISNVMRDRLRCTETQDAPWMTVQKARRAFETLALATSDKSALDGYLAYLDCFA